MDDLIASIEGVRAEPVTEHSVENQHRILVAEGWTELPTEEADRD